MISAYYTAAVSVIQTEKGMDVLANNIANVSTTGFRPSSTTFSQLLYNNLYNERGTLGHGTKLQQINVQQQLGINRRTDQPLDFMLTDTNSFFAIQTPAGIRYTRDGNFHFSPLPEGKCQIRTATNDLVLGKDGQPLIVDQETATKMETTMEPAVFSFANVGGLDQDGGNHFAATTLSGAAQAVENPNMIRGQLESSSVSVAEEMSNIIQMQRAFQFNTRLVQMSDEVLQTVNALR